MAVIKYANNNRYWQGLRGERNSCTLLVGMWNSTTSLENSIEVPQKTKSYHIIQQYYSWEYIWRNVSQDTIKTTARPWLLHHYSHYGNSPDVLQLMNESRKCGILFSLEEVCWLRVRTEDHHVKWSKLGSERQKSCVFSHMWKVDPNDKNTQMQAWSYTHTYIYIQNMFLIVVLFWGD
jgi:hypothetical protein